MPKGESEFYTNGIVYKLQWNNRFNGTRQTTFTLGTQQGEKHFNEMADFLKYSFIYKKIFAGGFV